MFVEVCPDSGGGGTSKDLSSLVSLHDMSDPHFHVSNHGSLCVFYLLIDSLKVELPKLKKKTLIPNIKATISEG